MRTVLKFDGVTIPFEPEAKFREEQCSLAISARKIPQGSSSK